MAGFPIFRCLPRPFRAPTGQPVSTLKTNTTTMPKSGRRSEDELIADLEAKIRQVEERMKKRDRTASPLYKDFERFKKHASKFAQSCIDNGRKDVANTVLGALNVAERQVQTD